MTDAWVFIGCCCAAAFLAGFQMRGWSDAKVEEIKQAATPEAMYGIRRASQQTELAVTLLGCPVTQERRLEWERVCRGRDRNEKIGSKAP